MHYISPRAGAYASLGAALALALALGAAIPAGAQVDRFAESGQEAPADAPDYETQYNLSEVMDVDDPNEHLVLRIDPGIGPVTADDILAARLLTNGEMFPQNVNLQLVDGELLYVPRPDLGPGFYNLIVDTGVGLTRVGFYLREDGSVDTFDQQMRVLDMREADVLALIGWLPDERTAELNLNIAPNYYRGQVVVIEMDIDPDNWYSWKVDGKEVMYGQGPHTFVHAFKNVGTDVIVYSERFGEEVEKVALDVVAVLPRP